MYPELLERINANNCDWLRSWGCFVTYLPHKSSNPQIGICLNPQYSHFNGVFSINCPENEAAALIKAQTERIERESGHKAAVWLDPYCRPKNLPVILSSLGFRKTATSFVLYTKATKVKGWMRTNLRKLSIRWVENALELGSWIDTYCLAGNGDLHNDTERWNLAFRKQELKFALGVLNKTNVPVVTGQLVTSNVVRGLYSIRTDPAYRHLGFGQAMTVYLSIVAQKERIDDVYLIAETESNKRFFEQWGFREILRNGIYEQS